MLQCPKCLNDDPIYLYQWHLSKYKLVTEQGEEGEPDHQISQDVDHVEFGKIERVRCGKCDYETTDPSEFGLTV